MIDSICSHFHLSCEAFWEGDARDIAIYLLKRHTGMTSREIAELLKASSHSAVAKSYQRFSDKLNQDHALQKTVEAIRAKMSNVKT